MTRQLVWSGLLACALAGTVSMAQAGPNTPQVFAPGIISGPADDADPALTPDGSQVVFVRNGVLLISTRQGDGWSKPVMAPFSGEWYDQQPAMAPDGSHLVFVSNRPATPGGPRLNGNVWRVDLQGGHWGQPVHLPPQVNRTSSIWAPDISGDGSLYFIARGAAGTPFKIWRAQRQAGGTGYAEPVQQSFGDPATKDVDPAVAPDESLIIFSSTHQKPDEHERMYLACRTATGWSKPIDLGPEINGDGSSDVNEPRISPDGHTLYFATDRTLPFRMSSTREEAARTLERIEAWDNGRQNIWSVPLDPIRAQCRSAVARR
jgi:Tol biopolymer transport system component